MLVSQIKIHDTSYLTASVKRSTPSTQNRQPFQSRDKSLVVKNFRESPLYLCNPEVSDNRLCDSSFGISLYLL